MIAEWIGALPGATFFTRSVTAYIFLNAAHILGIGLLVGAILPLDLRMMGFFRATPLAVLAPFLSRAAGFGLCLVLLTGLWLVSIRPAEYFSNPAFLVKMALIACALVNLATLHLSSAWRTIQNAGQATSRMRVQAALSFIAWIGAILAGRWIGFV